jgi:hypothetical protein
LPDTSRRTSATIYDLGTQSDGAHRYALAGGDGDPGAADRFALSDTATATITGLGAQVAALDGGALLSAFAPDGSPASGAAMQLPPEATMPAPIATAPALDGARLVSLEDGSVLAIGGDAVGQVARYLPTANAWLAASPAAAANGAQTGALAMPALSLLPDGSVLVLGGASASAAAWIYRPSLVGPSSGLVVVEPDMAQTGVLTALDPATVTRTGGTFSLTGDPAIALVGGARTSTGSVNAAVKVTGDHVQLIARSLGAGRALVGDLAAGSPAQIARVDGGTMKILCSGQVVPAFDSTVSTAVGLAVSGGNATLSLAAMPLVSCSLAGDPDASDRGAWGIASVGGTRLDIATITVQR